MNLTVTKIPVRELNGQVAQLVQSLRYARDNIAPAAADGGRAAAFVALNAVDDFLTFLLRDRQGELLVPLRQLQYALADLDRGKTVPLLKRTKLGHRPKDATAEQGFRAVAALAMHHFIEDGLSRSQAAREVCKYLTKLGYRDGKGNPIRPAQVEQWRNRATTERPAEDLSAGRFRRMQGQVAQLFPGQPGAAARHMLGRLPLIVPPQIPKNPRT